MVAPSIRGGNGFNADLCAASRGAAPPSREQREQLRGCVGSAGSPRGGVGGGGVEGIPGQGPEQRLEEEPLPGGGLSLRSSGGCCPAWGPHQRVTEEKKISATKGQWVRVGVCQGRPGCLCPPSKGQKAELGGVSPSRLVPKVTAKI